MLLVVTAGEGKAREGSKDDDKRFGLLGYERCKADNKFTEVLNVILVDDCELEVLFPINSERETQTSPKGDNRGASSASAPYFLF